MAPVPAVANWLIIYRIVMFCRASGLSTAVSTAAALSTTYVFQCLLQMVRLLHQLYCRLYFSSYGTVSRV